MVWCKTQKIVGNLFFRSRDNMSREFELMIKSLDNKGLFLIFQNFEAIMIKKFSTKTTFVKKSTRKIML